MDAACRQRSVRAPSEHSGTIESVHISGPSDADEFTRLVPTPPAAIVGDAGHLPQVERLNDTWKAVGGFLRCLDPAPALS